MNKQLTISSYYLRFLILLLQRKNPIIEIFFKGRKVLDIGCGMGEFLSNDSKNFTGVDINKECLSQCKSKGLNVIRCDITKRLKLKSTYDAIHCSSVIEHLDCFDAYKMLANCGKLLKKNGILMIKTEMVTPHFWNTFSHVRPYSPKSLVKITSNTGGETFPKILTLKLFGILYLGMFYESPILNGLSSIVAQFIPVLRRSYLAFFIRK